MFDQLADPTLPDVLALTGAALAHRAAIRELSRRLVPTHQWYCLLIPYLCPHR